MKLLLDEHMSGRQLGEALRTDGHDVRAAAEEPALAGTADDALLRIASAEGRILITHNVKDFAPILADWAGSGEQHAGCILVKGVDHSQVGLLLRGLRALLAERSSQEEWVDLALWLTPGSTGA